MVVNTAESGVLVLDKQTGKWNKINIPEVNGLTTINTFIPTTSILYDGKYIVLNVEYNKLNQEEDTVLDITESYLHMYDFESDYLKKIFNIKGKYNILD